VQLLELDVLYDMLGVSPLYLSAAGVVFLCLSAAAWSSVEVAALCRSALLVHTLISRVGSELASLSALWAR
jgi:hypothetical protein